MIYLKQIFNGRTVPILAALSLALIMASMQVESSKITYKKPIPSKATIVKDKHSVKSKISEETKSTAKPATPVAPTTTARAETTIHEELEVAETTHAVKSAVSIEEKPTPVAGAADDQQHAETAINSMEFREVALPIENVEENQVESEKTKAKAKAAPAHWIESQERTVVEEPLKFEEVSTIAAVAANSLETPTTAGVLTSSLSPTTTAAAAATTTTTSSTAPPTTTAVATPPTTPSNRPVACTCGVFMTSQIKRTGNPYEPPVGRPVIMNELDRTYPCNAVGQKQCQTKCLEAIVQHLPNSANILCASLDHDIRKERAYLFIKNCRNQWFNTNLAAGREYCCKNGQPYQCPLV